MSKFRFVNRWPSITAFAEDVGVSFETAKGINHRERIGAGIIPDRYWLKAVAGAKKRKIAGVTLTSLAEAAESLAASAALRRRSSADQRAA